MPRSCCRSWPVGPTSLSAYENAVVKKGADFTVASKGLAVALDLSDLGYAPGASVDGLFLQDAQDAGSPRHLVDPTFIAGLPHD